jgi:hypothetical protein
LLHTVVAMVKVINKSQQRLHSKSVATVSTTRSGDVLNTYDVIGTREVIDNCNVIDTCDVLRTFIVIQESRDIYGTDNLLVFICALLNGGILLRFF